MLVIGLTGGIGSGKTAASDHFQSLGIEIVDADIVSREVVEPGRPALSSIAERFGSDILNPDGTLDRKSLRNIIFNSKTQKSWLETLLHPIIRAEILAQLNAAKSPYSILVSPLLFETDQKNIVDRILLIDTDLESQLYRASTRDNTNIDNIKKIVDSQSPRSFKQKHADDIIINDKTIEDLHKQVETMHKQYLRIAREQTT